MYSYCIHNVVFLIFFCLILVGYVFFFGGGGRGGEGWFLLCLLVNLVIMGLWDLYGIRLFMDLFFFLNTGYAGMLS